MQFSPASHDGAHAITAFSQGSITIDHQVYTNAVLVTPTEVTHSHINHFDQIDEATLNELLALNPEVIVIGTGTKAHLPTRQMLNLAQTKSIGIEVMPTDSACRTYNLMSSDERRIIALLLVQ